MALLHLTHTVRLTKRQREALDVEVGDALILHTTWRARYAAVVERAARYHVDRQNADGTVWFVSRFGIADVYELEGFQRPAVVAFVLGSLIERSANTFGCVASWRECAKRLNSQLEDSYTGARYSVRVDDGSGEDAYCDRASAPGTLVSSADSTGRAIYERLRREADERSTRLNRLASERPTGSTLAADVYCARYGCTLEEMQARDLDDEEYEEPALSA